MSTKSTPQETNSDQRTDYRRKMAKPEPTKTTAFDPALASEVVLNVKNHFCQRGVEAEVYTDYEDKEEGVIVRDPKFSNFWILISLNQRAASVTAFRSTCPFGSSEDTEIFIDEATFMGEIEPEPPITHLAELAMSRAWQQFNDAVQNESFEKLPWPARDFIRAFLDKI